MTEHKTIATHSGSFHADDVFGVGVLMGVFPSHRLILPSMSVAFGMPTPAASITISVALPARGPRN